jgi:hypothetical protein
MDDLKEQFMAVMRKLTKQQRTYVEHRLKGASKNASAYAATGQKGRAPNFDRVAFVQDALRLGMELTVDVIIFDRKMAHEMLMEAHSCASNTIEQVTAIRELIRLHGLESPKKVHLHQTGKVEHEHGMKEVKGMTDAELLKLAQLPESELPRLIENVEYEEVGDAE